MEKHDQGHPHPKLKVPRLTCLGRESNPGLSGGMPRFEQRVNSMVPPSACDVIHWHTWTEHTWTALGLGCRPNRTCTPFNPEYWQQALASLHINCQARQITSGSPLCESRDWHVLAGTEPGPLQREVSNLAKSYSNSVLIAIQNIYILARDSILLNIQCGINRSCYYSILSSSRNIFEISWSNKQEKNVNVAIKKAEVKSSCL